ncbi:MAG TPA: hypothetical protein VGG97_15270 [Bryobacteraceae bacterium]|jgi:hypothetical protein
MATGLIQQKQQAHLMLDLLPPEKLSAVVNLLEVMLDPVSRAITHAPVDDEPLTPEDEKALNEAREWMKHNQGIPHEQVLADLGISQEEIENYRDSA